jgi:asparagine synthase (glutamine-hydrolysing)
MSVQFGRWNVDGKSVDPTYVAKIKPVIVRYGLDDEGRYAISNLNILYHAFHTTSESRRETQPHVSKSGTVFTWDGRLDNRTELICQLQNVLTNSSTDVSIVATAYEKWGAECFAKFIGDWALSIWDAKSLSLILANDPIGTRHLYYSIDNDQVTWSTILDPLVLFAGKSFALCEEYVAGWFSSFPACHLTPYVGIQSVPPSCSVVIRNGKQTVTRYWDFDPGKRIRYDTDAEYEEHFRAVFREAVRRRLRSDRPVLAELSGGMDSSSIVCTADTIIARGEAETPRLDTISYYDDSEPNWDERTYFTKVEEKRGHTGCHIDVGTKQSLDLDFVDDRFLASPGSGGGRPSEAGLQFANCLTSQGNRVVLSGTGGDEVTGGVPTPTPELQDLLATGQFSTLVHQLKDWALTKRRPWFHLLLEAGRGFFPPELVGVSTNKRPAPWLTPRFVKRNRAALRGYSGRLNLFGPLPSFQDNLSTLDGLRRQLLCSPLSSEPIYEKRYPYLDRSLLEFLYAIPREQLVRPGQRRALMRRALVGIVPEEVLNRRRKAFVARAPIIAMSTQWNSLLEMSLHMISDSLGIVDAGLFSKALQNADQGQQIPIVSLKRTVAVEFWLRVLKDRNVLDVSAFNDRETALASLKSRAPNSKWKGQTNSQLRQAESERARRDRNKRFNPMGLNV